MRRVISVCLALIVMLIPTTPAFAAQYAPGDTYIRILGSSGTMTVGIKTTYGKEIWKDGAYYIDDRLEFVYTTDGVNWSVGGTAPESLAGGRYDGTRFLACSFQISKPSWQSRDGIHWEKLTDEEQAQAPALTPDQTTLSGYRFRTDGEGNVWVEDSAGHGARLTAFDAFLQRGYRPAEIQAYPVPGGIRVAVYAKYAYDVTDAYTYSTQELDRLLGKTAAAPTGTRVIVNGTPVQFSIPLYQVKGCAMAPLRGLAEAMGYDFSYQNGTAVCARAGSSITVSAGSTWTTVNGETTNWLAVPAELHGGIFCVPVRFFGEAAQAQVVWDAAGQTFWLTQSAG